MARSRHCWTGTWGPSLIWPPPRRTCPWPSRTVSAWGERGRGGRPGGSWGAGRQLPAPAGALPALRPPPLSPGAPAPSPLLGRVTPGRWPRLKARGAQGSGPGTAPFHSTHPPRPLPGLSRPPRPSFQDAYRHLAHYLFY